jgi:hypothetical protein
VNIPSAKADGFSGKLCGIPLALRLKPRTGAEKRPLLHNHRRGNIAVEDAAARTAVRSFRECLGFDCVTVGTFLRCATWIDGDDHGTGSCSLVPKHHNQVRPRSIQYIFGKHTARQAVYVQLLNSNARKSLDQICREFVEEIGPAPRNLIGICGEARPSFVASLAATFTARPRPLPSPQPLRGQLRPIRSFDKLAIRQRNNRGKPTVNANHLAGAGFGFLYLDAKNNKPLAGLAADYSSFEHCVDGQWPMPFALNLARNTDNPEPRAFPNCQPVSHPEVGAVETRSCSEPRKTSLSFGFQPSEECGEGFIKTPQDLLLSAIAKAGQTFVGKPNRFQLICLVDIPQAFATAPPRLDALLKASVVEFAEAGEHVFKRTCLDARRIEPVAKTEYQFEGPSFRYSGSSVKCLPAVNAAGGRAFLAKFPEYRNRRPSPTFRGQLKHASLVRSK